MELRHWTRRQIRALTAGRTLYLRDASAQPADAPAWLVEGSELGRASAVERLALLHENDRMAYLDAYTRAVSGSVPTELRYRVSDGGGGWVTEHARILNLLGHPEVRAVVVAVERSDDRAPGRDDDGGRRGGREPAAWFVAHLTDDSRIRRAEGRVEEMTGRTADELVGLLPVELLHPDSHGDLLVSFVELHIDPTGTAHGTRCFVHPDGTEVWAECIAVRRPVGPGGDEDDRDAVLLVAVDISDRLAKEEELRASHEEFRLLAEDLPAAVYRADGDGRIVYRNESFTRLVPGAADIESVIELFDPEAWASAGPDLGHQLADGADRVELEILGADGRTTLALTARLLTGPAGSRSFVGTVTDVTATVALRRRADHDLLTGLLNRHALREELAATFRADRHGTLVLFIDLDGFKAVNDTYGHAVGDDVIEEIGRRLRSVVRPGDLVGRYGGDEFVLACRDLADDDRHRAERTIRQRLQEALAEPVRWAGGSWLPAASVGVARPRPGETPEDVLARADVAMFAAKRRHAEAAPTGRER